MIDDMWAKTEDGTTREIKSEGGPAIQVSGKN
jgi:hypothetical protein